MLARLEKKGYVKHQQDGLRYLYSATISPAAAKRTALQQYVQTFFGGSLKQMMTSLVTEGSWSDDDLEGLKAEIDRVRKERKQRP
jgi:predicted transcriptional regulator